jgi:hypothetical protein
MMGFFNRIKQEPPAAGAQRVYEAQRMRALESMGVDELGAASGTRLLTQPIGKQEVQKATLTLNKYKEGKANLEQKIIDNEQWWKLRHWECMRDKKSEVQPTSGWLFNCIVNKLGSAMDNFPSPNVLPREEGDKAEAEMLSSILPVVLEQNNFEEIYNEEQLYKLIAGAGAYGVFWDSSKMNGLGDISIQKVDLISLFWESGVTDIQKSRNVYHVELVDNDILAAKYPQLANRLSNPTINVSKYMYDDKVDTTEKSAVVDWYYKKNVNGKTVLHYCKFVNDEVLFATENDPIYAERGWYDHGLYPFVVDPLFRIAGSIAGFGYIDVGKDAQSFIDRGNKAVLRNMLANAAPRHFIRTDGSVNEDEYADLDNDFVHVDGNLGQDSILPIQGKPLDGSYITILRDKVDELKETTGNRDVSNGGTSGGVTAASGLAAMMENASRLDRLNGKGSYRAFRSVCLMLIELIRQFYDTPRKFRILGENGAMRYVEYSNANIKPQHQGYDFGLDMGYRLPLFDVEVTASKQSPYSKMAQNELALQFYQAGFFNPQMADQALACLDMMDFDRKEFIMQKIAQNGGMYQQMLMMQQQILQLAQIVDQDRGTRLAEQMAAGIMGGAPVAPIGGNVGGQAPSAKVGETEALGGKEGTKESHVTKNARARVAESTNPT